MYISITGTFLGKEKKIINNNNNKEKTTDLDFERVAFGTNLQFYLLICLSNTHRWWENYTKIMDKLERGGAVLKEKATLTFVSNRYQSYKSAKPYVPS